MFNLIVGFVAGVLVCAFIPKVVDYDFYVQYAKEFLAKFGSK